MSSTCYDPILGLLAESVDDLESTRIATENRLRSLASYDLETTREAEELTLLCAQLLDAEKHAIKNLERRMKAHQLWPTFKDMQGIGRKQLARLLAAIGDPAWNTKENRPRTFGELVAFCGLDPVNGQGRRKRRGERANWNGEARKRLWLIATSCVKEPGRTWPMDGEAAWQMRRVYEQGRNKYAHAVHASECVRCGPAGEPAAAGTPLPAGHQNARAIRLVMREILAIAYNAAQKVHLEGTINERTP